MSRGLGKIQKRVLEILHDPGSYEWTDFDDGSELQAMDLVAISLLKHVETYINALLRRQDGRRLNVLQEGCRQLFKAASFDVHCISIEHVFFVLVLS